MRIGVGGLSTLQLAPKINGRRSTCLASIGHEPSRRTSAVLNLGIMMPLKIKIKIDDEEIIVCDSCPHVRNAAGRPSSNGRS